MDDVERSAGMETHPHDESRPLPSIFRVPVLSMVLHGGEVALACGVDGQLQEDALHGLFAGDTRVLSTYRIGIGGWPWHVLGRSRLGSGTARWELQNPELRAPEGDIAAGTLLCSLRRRVDGVLHDDLRVRSFDLRPIRARLTLQIDADFADVFEVHDQTIPSRPRVARVPGDKGLTFSYEREGFRRSLEVQLTPSSGKPLFAGALIVFDLELPPGATWTCCVQMTPVVDGTRLAPATDVHGPERLPAIGRRGVTVAAPPVLSRPFERGCADLRALAVPQKSPSPWVSVDVPTEVSPFVAAGVPWFLTLFGRDSLVTALMAGLHGAWLARGALVALGERQAVVRDDFHDAEPGKIMHEMRRGELAHRGAIVASPYYYGTHDAPELYCLALWNAWRWTGDDTLLASYLEHAKAAMRWCDEFGDRDGDGLLEYATRSPKGYYNQSWKDAGAAVVNTDGSLAELPIATVELQGYLFAARLAMVELLTAAGDLAGAERMRQAAITVQALVEERFWLEDQGYYAFALDGKKRPVTSIASNPGHLLWCGLPRTARAARVAEVLLRPDMFSGWGLRTLSAHHPAYNPLSYQRGSVWPHDTALAAAGLWRYGLREAACTLLRAIVEAAHAFEEDRLPELFCGLDRSDGAPVPYEKANSPQAWAAAAPILAAQLFVGLVPDAPRGRCFVAPWLPEWLPHLALRGIAIGRGCLDIRIARRGGETVIEELSGEQVEVIKGSVEAPLWGEPIGQ
ncbi:MAG TPA: glycogen debranching N-terminal domain-containing protein [Ktedonobacterales bacterium]